MERSRISTAFISIGSNIGDKLTNCEKGVNAIDSSAHCQLVDQSKYYATEPVDFLDQDWFVNAVLKVETCLQPDSLLSFLLQIQNDTGRKKEGVRFGPRVLDLDILLYDQHVVRTSTLELPHPRMHKRRFVLIPICDIDPAVIHPVLNTSMRDLLNELDEQGQEVTEYSCYGS